MSQFYNNGEGYYIDIESITDRCKIIGTDDDGNESTEVNIFKYEVLKMCLDRVLNEIDEVDEELGHLATRNSTTSFKLAYNTLIKYEILIEDDE